MKIKRVLKTMYLISDIIVLKLCKKKIAFMLNVPLHGNLGDQALAYAEKLFFQTEFPEYKYIEVNGSDINVLFLKMLKKLIRRRDLVCIQAGGYLGTLWIYEEYRVRKILESLKEKNIIIFPQTIFYGDSKKDLDEYKTSIRIYNACSNLTLCAREKKSYEIMKKAYKNCNVLLVPDMVTYLPSANYAKERKGCLVCMRSDSEKTCSETENKKLLSIISKHFKNVRHVDTVVNYKVKSKDREVELKKLWKQFSSAEIVFTDRLHGMIFSLLTGTPCIVIHSKSYKVEGVYDWIKNNKYIKMCNSIEEVEENMQVVLDEQIKTYDRDSILPHFEPLIKRILQHYKYKERNI